MDLKPCSCGSSEKFLRLKGSATGLYCMACEKWVKWVGKKDLPDYKRRGFKVHPEGYFPPSRTSDDLNGSHTQGVTNTPEYLHQYASPMHQEHPNQPEHTYVEDNLPDVFETTEEDFDHEEEGFDDESEMYQGRPNNMFSQPKHTPDYDNPCRTCLTGVVESLDSHPIISVGIVENILNVYNKDKTKLYGSHEINFCPSCGKKL